MLQFRKSLSIFTLSLTAIACQPVVEAPAVKSLSAAAVVKSSPAPKRVHVKMGEVTSISIEQLATLKMKDEVIMIDTRPKVFYAMGHVNGALSVPLKQVEKNYVIKQGEIEAAVKSGKLLVVYCANLECKDSHKMAVWLAEKGYDVSVFEGGWEMWKQAGLE